MIFYVKFTLKISIALTNAYIVQNSVVLINCVFDCVFYNNIAFINCLYFFELKEIPIYRLSKCNYGHMTTSVTIFRY